MLALTASPISTLGSCHGGITCACVLGVSMDDLVELHEEKPSAKRQHRVAPHCPRSPGHALAPVVRPRPRPDPTPICLPPHLQRFYSSPWQGGAPRLVLLLPLREQYLVRL